MLALQGAALFACIPLVLWLYLAQPLGAGWSLAVGVGLMLGHRFIAAPWAFHHGRERCLWCGRAGPQAERLEVDCGGAVRDVGACSAAHLDLARRFLGFTNRYRILVAAGIFVPLAALLGGTLADALGHPLIPRDLNAWQFRVIVAATVVTTSFAYRASEPAQPAKAAFPLHNLALLGIRQTLWVFRLVGAWWLVAGILRLL